MNTKLRAACGTHPGRVRETNEDAVYAAIHPSRLGGRLSLLIVADGIGGHLAGEVASQLAVKTILESFQQFAEVVDDSTDNGRPRTLESLLRESIRAANLAIHRYAREHPLEAGNLGTTIACAVLQDGRVSTAHVGDSRVYLFRGGRLQQLTSDHSFVGSLVRSGQLEPDAVYEHPHRSIITRALGFHKEVQIDTATWQLRQGDQLLLCTDGLWEMVREDQEIIAILEGSPTPAEAVQRLIDAANEKGGTDNIGVVILEWPSAAE